MSVTCPCCGGDMPTPGLAALRHVSLPPHERRVLDILINAYPRPIRTKTLVDRVYADDPSGGPDTAENAVRVYLCRLRPTLSRYGWRVGARGHGGGGIRLSQVPDTLVNEKFMSAGDDRA